MDASRRTQLLSSWWMRALLVAAAVALLWVGVPCLVIGVQAIGSAFPSHGDTTDSGLGLVIGVPLVLAGILLCLGGLGAPVLALRRRSVLSGGVAPDAEA